MTWLSFHVPYLCQALKDICILLILRLSKQKLFHLHVQSLWRSLVASSARQSLNKNGQTDLLKLCIVLPQVAFQLLPAAHTSVSGFRPSVLDNQYRNRLPRFDSDKSSPVQQGGAVQYNDRQVAGSTSFPFPPVGPVLSRSNSIRRGPITLLFHGGSSCGKCSVSQQIRKARVEVGAVGR